MIDWKIQARSQGCQSCGQKFADKQSYYTLLFDRRHVLERFDVCARCWESQYGHGANDRKGFISFWQGIFAEPPPAAPEPIQKESAETLLRKLIEIGDEQYTAPAFILAVMLERKRVFKVKTQSLQDGQRTIVYEHAKTGDVFTILDPNLQLNQLEQVQHLIARLLEHGFDAPGEGAAPAHHNALSETAPTESPGVPTDAAGDAATALPDVGKPAPENDVLEGGTESKQEIVPGQSTNPSNAGNPFPANPP